jgi:hypothetical protein
MSKSPRTYKITASRYVNATGKHIKVGFVPTRWAQELELEADFYRKLLEQVCDDSRKTRARRIVESGLMFWDQMTVEKQKLLHQRIDALISAMG